MDPQSPPKRMTRARAAKTESTLKTTKIVTAAAKAKTTRSTTASTSTATKRKTRSDDVEEYDQDNDELGGPEPVAKTTRGRGRPKKLAEPEPAPEPEPAAPRTRGRPKRVVEEPPKQEPTRATRASRARKAAQLEETPLVEPEEKKTTRARAAPATKSTTRTTVKKTVKFEEPEKENIAPPAASKGRGATTRKASEQTAGMRAKPVRRAAAGGRVTRATRSAAAQAEEKYDKPVPLSPKKITQIALNHRAPESEDELAIDEQTPVKPRVRGPAKLPVRIAKPEMPPAARSEDGETKTGPTIMLGSPCRRPPPSPWKDAMKSPAKRVESLPGLALVPSLAPGGQTGQSPMKASLLQSPAKRPPSPIKDGDTLFLANTQKESVASPFKRSLMSPPKRPMSPIKAFSSTKRQEENILGRTPVPKPALLATLLPEEISEAMENVNGQEEFDMLSDQQDDGAEPESPTPNFPGRLSAVLPRHADPALVDEELSEKESADEDEVNVAETADGNDMPEADGDMAEEGDPMHLDEPAAELTEEEEPAQEERATTTPPASPPRYSGEMFKLRDRALDTHDGLDSDSEDELSPTRTQGRADGTLVFDALPATPCPASSRLSSMKSAGRSAAKRARTDPKFGFTPLIHQLNGWTAGPSPLRVPDSPDALSSTDVGVAPTPTRGPDTPATAMPSPVVNAFFEEAISADAHPDIEAAIEADIEAAMAAEILEPEFSDASISEEDIALAKEADEMSLSGPEQVEDRINHEEQEDPEEDPDETLSEASQEYGDENDVPVDPALLPAVPEATTAVPPVTPQRVLIRDFHTVSKVPLKPADDSTPRPQPKRRGHSISRLPVQRPPLGTRNATVISYSPTKQQPEDETAEEHDTNREQSVPPVTPTKSEAGWSMVGTPARTSRRDINPALLRGAVVFVDVHTSEGADASGVFVELLTQMGARCVKSWAWNPSSPPGPGAAAGSSSRIGITHVVYKDGGKRTLEKVRESAGVVQCVGVSWVLDCERENQWLDESPYYIDTSLVPRGGARRRKSMEPKALASMDGLLASTPARNSSVSARECHTAPSTPMNRRDSALWIRTPEGADADTHGDSEWDSALLTPVPKTPAPEAIARFAANVTPETPRGGDAYEDDLDDEADDDDGVDMRGPLGTRTCPPKRTTAALGVLGDDDDQEGGGKPSLLLFPPADKDERVMMRLMAARRKSLQFAPKVGSPLARAWK